MDATPSPVLSDPLIKGPTFLAFALLAFASTLFLLGYHLWQTHSQALDAVTTNSSNLARVLEEHLDQTLHRVDADLLQIAFKVTSAKLTQETAQRDRTAWISYLASFKTNFPGIGDFYVFNAKGQLLVNSDPEVSFFSIADRAHFQRLRDASKAELVFSDVLISRTNGRPMMVVARGLRDPAGRFIGIVSATVNFDYLDTVLNSIKIGEHGAITLGRSDNQKLVLRHPSYPDDYHNANQSEVARRILAGETVGVARYLSSIDKVFRTGSFRVLADYPFYVNVAIADTDAFILWRRNAIRSILGAMLLLAALGLVLFRLWHTERLRQDAIRELDRIAQIDELTSLSNRRNFMMRSEQELLRTLRYGGCLSVLMMDIDNFKAINDTYGHKTGDIVLKKLADLCRQSLRSFDIVGRIGGEEFAFLFPNTDITFGIQAAERMRAIIEQALVKTEGGQLLQFTVSIGVTALADTRSTIESLLSQADKALYEAKHAGRNHVCIYEPQMR